MTAYSSPVHYYSTPVSHNYADAIPSAVARFSDSRCTAGGVCPTDSLVFTCEVNEVLVLRLTLPTGDTDSVSFGDTEDDLNLPDGFTADSLVIMGTEESTRNFTLTLFIRNASILNDGNIACDDTTVINRAMAGCPLVGELLY